MGSFKVKRLDLPEHIVETLERQNLHTCKDVLSLTVLELQSLFGISYKNAIRIQSVVSRKCVSDPCTVYDLLIDRQKNNKNAFFLTSLYGLDMLLQGGLPVGSVTEISGPPGVGKTQFCFMLCLLATLPTEMGGLNGQVIYIDTESAFSATRLQKMAQNKYPQIYQLENDTMHLLQRIFVHKASTVYDLKEIVPNIETEIIQKKVKLVIVDSIASLFRKEYGAPILQSVVERNNILLELTAVLKDIAETYNIVVFLTNQITSHSMDYDSTLPEQLSTGENGDCDKETLPDISECLEPIAKKPRIQQGLKVDCISPALGIAWSHCVNTRLVAQFLNSQVHQLIIAKSPVAPNAAVRYILNEAGIAMTDDDIEYVNMGHTEQQNLFTRHHFLTEEVTGTGTILSVNTGMKL